MTIQMYTCPKCGAEKEVALHDGETTDNISCACKHAPQTLSAGSLMINKKSSDTHSNGCGNNCGCH